MQVNGVRWHQCPYCSKEFKKPSDLVRHIRIHTHEKPYKCTQCFRAFAVKSTLTAHIKTHTGVKDYKCEECNKLFSTQGSLKVHLRLHTGVLAVLCCGVRLLEQEESICGSSPLPPPAILLEFSATDQYFSYGANGPQMMFTTVGENYR